MSVFTSIGSGLWAWEPFRRLERHPGDIVGRCAKLFWVALYTAPEAKLVVPGMFLGSVTTMAEAARGMQPDEVRTYLDRLIEGDLVEYDQERRVLRMTQLPDCGESPANGKAILGWWRRFQTVPDCAVRNRHVTTLRWIMDEWCRVNGKTLSHGHQEAWQQTFGRVTVPAPLRQKQKHVQTDLFTVSDSSDPNINNLDSNTSRNRFLQDQDPDKDQDPDLRSEGGVGGGTVLRLVPVTAAFDADDLAEALYQGTGGKFPQALTKPQRQALQHAIEVVGASSADRAQLDVLRDYMKHGAPGLEPPRDTLTVEERAVRSRGISPELVASPGWLAAALQKAREWAARCAEQLAMAAESRKQLGHE